MSRTGTPRQEKSDNALMDHRALPSGYMLGGYRIKSLLGRGGFAFTYRATADVRGQTREMAIKELFPEGLVRESQTGVVKAAGPTEAELFNFAFARFEQEAQALMRCQHPHVVRILDCFDYNGTAYLVMPYEEGEQLKNYCRSLGHDQGEAYQMPQEEIFASLTPLLEALDYVHGKNIFHRDIKPENIFLTDGKGPLLLDFGAAKLMNHWNRKENNAGTVAIESRGYSPFEQLHLGGNIGPWTDIYSMGAVLHYLINPQRAREKQGAPPPSGDRRWAMSNGDDDPYEPLAERSDLARRYPVGLLAGIDWALRPHAKDRPQSVGEWRSCLMAPSGTAPVTGLHTSRTGAPATSSYRTAAPPTSQTYGSTPVHGANGSAGGAWQALPNPALSFGAIFTRVLLGFILLSGVCFGIAYLLKQFVWK